MITWVTWRTDPLHNIVHFTSPSSSSMSWRDKITTRGKSDLAKAVPNDHAQWRRVPSRLYRAGLFGTFVTDRQTDGQTPRTLVTIDCISCIRCMHLTPIFSQLSSENILLISGLAIANWNCSKIPTHFFIFEVYMHICLQFLGTSPLDPHWGSAAKPRWGVSPSRPSACSPISKFRATPPVPGTWFGIRTAFLLLIYVAVDVCGRVCRCGVCVKRSLAFWVAF